MFVAKIIVFLIKVKITWPWYLTHIITPNTDKHIKDKSGSWIRVEKPTNLRVWKVSQLIEVVIVSKRDKVWKIKGYLCRIDRN